MTDAIDWTRGTVGGTQLRPQSLAVLKLLHDNAGQVVTKDEIMAAVWPDVAVTDDSLVQCITEIRKALGDAEHTVVKTLPKRGYVFESNTGGTSHAAKAPDPKPIELPAIAVLPFTNLSDDPKGDKFADMMTEDVITDLSHAKDFAVIARNSTQVYKGKAVDVRDVGHELNVQYVLEGSVQPMPGKVRATAQLIDAETGRHIWSERFEKQGDDIFAIEGEIVALIASSIVGHGRVISTNVRSLSRRKPPEHWSAYEAYQMGLEELQKLDPAVHDKCEAYFSVCLRIDPNFARAYVGLTWLMYQRFDFGGMPCDVGLKRMYEYAKKAEALDRYDGEVHAVLGHYYAAISDFDRMLAHANLAEEFAPNNADVLILSAWALYASGHPERAIANVNRAFRLNPHCPDWYNPMAQDAYFWCGEYRLAHEHGKRSDMPSINWMMIKAITTAMFGTAEEAAKTKGKLLEFELGFCAEKIVNRYYAKFKRDIETNRFVEAASQAGLRICMTTEEFAATPGAVALPQCSLERAKEK